MKKLLLTVVAAVLAVAASAQVYVGGEAGLWRNYDANHTSFTLQPEVGYHLGEKWAIGTTVGFAHAYVDGVKLNGAIIAPYARYSYAKLGPVDLFIDGGFGFCTYKWKGADNSSNGWQVGLSPGLAVNLTEKLSFIAHVGFLGCRDSDDETNLFGENGFGFKLSGNDLRFGMVYNF